MRQRPQAGSFYLDRQPQKTSLASWTSNTKKEVEEMMAAARAATNSQPGSWGVRGSFHARSLTKCCVHSSMHSQTRVCDASKRETKEGMIRVWKFQCSNPCLRCILCISIYACRLLVACFDSSAYQPTSLTTLHLWQLRMGCLSGCFGGGAAGIMRFLNSRFRGALSRNMNLASWVRVQLTIFRFHLNVTLPYSCYLNLAYNRLHKHIWIYFT